MLEMHRQRLQETLREVEEAERLGRWNQGLWGRATMRPNQPRGAECATAYCFAGHAAANAPGVTMHWTGFARTADGSSIVLRDMEGRTSAPLASLIVPQDAGGYGCVVAVEADFLLVQAEGAKPVPVSHWAASYFGLDEMEGAILFDAGNTLDDLRLMVEELCDLGEIATVPRHIVDIDIDDDDDDD